MKSSLIKYCTQHQPGNWNEHQKSLLQQLNIFFAYTSFINTIVTNLLKFLFSFASFIFLPSLPFNSHYEKLLNLSPWIIEQSKYFKMCALSPLSMLCVDLSDLTLLLHATNFYENIHQRKNLKRITNKRCENINFTCELCV